MAQVTKWAIPDYNGVEICLRLFSNDLQLDDIWLVTQSEEDARNYWLQYNEFQYGVCPFIPKEATNANHPTY